MQGEWEKLNIVGLGGSLGSPSGSLAAPAATAKLAPPSSRYPVVKPVMGRTA
jgi:hypothetical protein